MDITEIEGFLFREVLMQSSRCMLLRAEQCTLERDVLMLLFQGEVLEDTQLAETLLRTLQTLTHVRSTVFPEIIDIVWKKDLAYVITEDCHAKNIVELLTDSRLDAQHLFQLAIGLAEGFSKLQELHLVYGALRPKSLYLSEESEAILPDFSMLQFEAGYGAVPSEDSIVGSVSYIAPEVYLAPETVDARADMFSLGMTLYALATGQVPYGALPPDQILEAKQTVNIPSPCDISPNFPPAFAAVLQKLAQRDPDNRYRDWDEVRFDLYQAQEGIVPEIGDPEGSIIAPPNPLARAKAGRTIRLSVSDLRSYRQKRAKKDRSKVLIAIIIALSFIVVTLLGILGWILFR